MHFDPIAEFEGLVDKGENLVRAARGLKEKLDEGVQSQAMDVMVHHFAEALQMEEEVKGTAAEDAETSVISEQEEIGHMRRLANFLVDEASHAQ